MTTNFTQEQIDAALAVLDAGSSEQQLAGLDLNALVAEAKKNLGVQDSEAENSVEATDGDTVNVLWIEAERLKKIADDATKEREKVTKILSAITPDGKKLTVGGATVFERSLSEGTAINSDYVKATHPQFDGSGNPIPENAPYWKPTRIVRSLYKR